MSQFGTYSITIGIVKNNDDQSQNGRLQVYCPAIDHEDYEIDDLSWCNYAPPIGGTISNLGRGPNAVKSAGPVAYGFWAIPKIGSQVIVYFLNSDSNHRYWTNQIYPIQSNRSLPGGRNYSESGSNGPFTDTDAKLEPSYSNAVKAGLASGDAFLKRGPYERQAAQAKTTKDGKDGYAPDKTANDGSLDPQTYCFVTPGGHYLSMQDYPDFCRVRLRTTSGSQLLLDDTNGFIYMSTDEGNSWIEMNREGNLFFYGAKSASFKVDKDFNVDAGGNINLHAASNINIKADSDVNVQSGKAINIKSGATTAITAATKLDIKAASKIVIGSATLDVNGGGAMKLSAGRIDLNGPPAATPQDAKSAESPSIVPAHEPWSRP